MSVEPSDAHRLLRFVEAQDPVFDQVLSELRGGAKRSHWMWFVFPQLDGLGQSPTARFYALAGLGEARAYLAHPVLGRRLHEALLALGPPKGRSLAAVFGSPDHLKFCSSMTLFTYADPNGDCRLALADWCGGRPDERTLELLKAAPPCR